MLTPRYFLLLILLLGCVACQKSDPTPTTPQLVTTGQLLGQWYLKEQRFRQYNGKDQLQRDDRSDYESQGFRYQAEFAASTIRYRQYIGSRLELDSTYAYSRRGLTLTVADHLQQEIKILELTDHQLTLEYRSNRPAGFYDLVEDHYMR